MNAEPPSMPRVLWVDDHPEHNVAERDVLSQHGYLVTTVRSTKQALAQTKNRSFVAIISDMGRFEGPSEGYVLLEALQEAQMAVPTSWRL